LEKNVIEEPAFGELHDNDFEKSRSKVYLQRQLVSDSLIHTTYKIRKYLITV